MCMSERDRDREKQRYNFLNLNKTQEKHSGDVGDIGIYRPGNATRPKCGLLMLTNLHFYSRG